MPQNTTTSTTLRNHRRKLRLEGIAHHLEQLSELHDSFGSDHPDRPGLIRQIAKWNIEYQVDN